MAERPLYAADQTASGAQWRLSVPQVRMVALASERHGLSPIAAAMLLGRDIGLDDIAAFLKPTLRADLPDPSILTDMEAATACVADAIAAGQAIAILGDYDVDGGTSTALLLRLFSALGVHSCFHIPDRHKEGYGPSHEGIDRLAARGAKVLITVDCGTLAFEALDYAAAKDLKTVILDHHLSATRFPRAAAIVNPNRLDGPGRLTELAAVGVTFMFAVALVRVLRHRNHFGTRPEPDLAALLDLVALGTICDMVPLVGVNRLLARQGLKVMAQRRNRGLSTLADIARLDGPPTHYHASFLLGPRINAGGRIGKSDLGARLLACDDADITAEIARELDRLNEERRAIEAAMTETALVEAEKRAETDAVLIVARPDWHAGIVGITASRMKERFGKPAFAMAIDGRDAKGSGRSIRGVDLGGFVLEATEAGLLSKGGGHKMAAGLSLPASAIDAFRRFANERLATAVAAARQEQSMRLDGELAPGGLTPMLAEELDALGPYGIGFPAPRFVVGDVTLAKVDTVGQGDHMRLFVTGRDGSRLKAMAFRAGGTPLGAMLLAQRGARVALAGRIAINRWQGSETAELHIEDAALGPPSQDKA